METATTELPLITIEKAKGELALALTKDGLVLQALQNRADKLVFLEDDESIKEIKEVLDLASKATKAVDNAHEIGKRPFLEGGRIWDSSKRHYSDLITSISTPVRAKFTALCAEIDRKKREADAKIAKEKEIRSGVESNILTYSSRIADATTTQELLSIESSISAQKAPQAKAKYGDLHDEAIGMYNTKLLPILKSQKEKIAESERIAKEIKDAEKTDDIEKLDELKAAQELVQDGIQENKVKVQEAALNQEFTPRHFTAHEVISPVVKAKRTTVEWEIVDVDTAIKKNRSMLTIEINPEEAKKTAKTLNDSGAFKGKEEVILNGIRFWIKKSY